GIRDRNVTGVQTCALPILRDAFGAGPRGQLFKLHTQTSGRSLIAAEFKNNLTRTAAELMLAYMNATNSCHSNSADEPFTTPSERSEERRVGKECRAGWMAK